MSAASVRFEKTYFGTPLAPIEVTVPDALMLEDERDAARDTERGYRSGWQGVGYDPGQAQRLAYCTRAYQAERAFALFVGVDYKRDPNGFGLPDVAGFSVRYGSGRHYGLVTHDRDKDYPYALVVSTEVRNAFVIAGFMLAARARKLREKRVGKPLPGSTSPWLIPQKYMQKEFVELLNDDDCSHCGAALTFKDAGFLCGACLRMDSMKRGGRNGRPVEA